MDPLNLDRNLEDDNMPEDMETFLSHHGIKGMKWGVRRTPAQLGHKPSSGKKKSKSSSKKQSSPRKKIKLSGLRKKKTVKKTVKTFRKASSYTDNELALAVRRLQLEKQYNQLVSEASKKTKSKGQKFLEDVGKELATNVKKEVAKAVEDEIRKAVRNSQRRN